ncbi:MAG: asparagine synthase (glutamine-hydrolyzing) [Chloroflexi bacterium]|nr:asparagine synthase (glutamine-hydrolyzing) [Chloroflexota bacterium]
MCGIVGALSFGDYQITEAYIARMRDTMAHRGPDGIGAWISPDGRVGFGQRRLAIIDLSTLADQPMCNEDGSIWLNFNGEIYNHAEIRAELERIGGHTWKTDHSDTETIIHAFEQWGIDALHKMRGMFAMALWDGNKRELWLIRDRIGVKPLYYSIHHGRLTYASEIKALLQDPQQTRAVNEEAFFHYLSFMTTPAPNTLFQDIYKLPPATWMRISETGATRSERYWDVWDYTTPLTDASEEEIAQRLIAELRTSVALRKVADVQVGVFLSGGIDSSTNTALFSEGESKPVKTFAIGYDGEYKSYKNEVHYARRMAEYVGAEYYEQLLTQDDLLNFVPRMVQLQDEPIGDPVCVPVYYVSKLAREHGVTVCQVGEGSDELFWGYEGWRTAFYRQQRLDSLPLPPGLAKLGLPALALAGKNRSLRYEYLRRWSEGLPTFWGGVDLLSVYQKEQLLSPRLRKQFKGLTSWEAIRPIYERYQSKAWEKSALNWMTYLDLSYRLPELLLMRVDKMSMGVSLEGRVPFLDYKFVELAMSIPTAVKTRNGTLKHILKKAVRGVIPDEFIDRKKQGFGVPVYEWFFDRLGGEIRRELHALCDKTDLFDRAELDRLMDTGQGALLWPMYNMALWWKEYIAQETTPLPMA